MHLRTLLAECAKKLNEYGPDSPEVEEFIRKNSHNEEFVQLAELARTLKREVLQRRGNQAPGTRTPGMPAPSVEAPQPQSQVPPRRTRGW